MCAGAIGLHEQPFPLPRPQSLFLMSKSSACSILLHAYSESRLNPRHARHGDAASNDSQACRHWTILCSSLCKHKRGIASRMGVRDTGLTVRSLPSQALKGSRICRRLLLGSTATSPDPGLGAWYVSMPAMTHITMRFGSTTKEQAKRRLKYHRVS